VDQASFLVLDERRGQQRQQEKRISMMKLPAERTGTWRFDPVIPVNPVERNPPHIHAASA
jgi:hypothetical protein